MMQRQHTTESVARHGKPSRKKGLGFDKLCIDDTIDEGYSSGNPPPFTTQYPKLDASSDPDAATQLESKMSKQKVINNNWTSGNRDHKNNSKLVEENLRAPEERLSRPKMLQRSESRTFVFIYDEEEKKSKAVAAPDNLNVDVPVLLQYNLTEEAIEKCLEKPQLGNSPTEDNGETEDNMNIPAVAADKALALGGKFCPPTERLLRSREKDELKNKGMHVVKWLVNLDHSIEEPLTDS
ncbi:uncharacterized protein LOC115919355 [Strongylocentrotus purpuratus]|uniref:Uncharacterized protein n=1 Tax=Strongylocentrotus purpuratus TaxID=7668 RepID=A0A7M7MZJ9_STRPU|nr:uncharacterized protein LOC115919355 [Strongylocentrotus purpuratus]